MKGYVPTPSVLVDRMVDALFATNTPKPSDYLLDPGCGGGQFIHGVLRWCQGRNMAPPRIVGVELNPSLAAKSRQRFRGETCVEIINVDYLVRPLGVQFRYVIANPPYVSLSNIKENRRKLYRAKYVSAYGRFDLYMLFFEQAIKDTAPGGRLVFVTPEKFLYVDSAKPLRKLLTEHQVRSIHLESEDAFSGRITYPATTVIQKDHVEQVTHATLRGGAERVVRLPKGGGSWWPAIMGHKTTNRATPTLGDYCLRISAGVATGANSVFVRDADTLETPLRPYTYSALAGRDISIDRASLPVPTRSILVPYNERGQLLSENRLGALGRYLHEEGNHARLVSRTCVKKKPWYAFHDNCPLPDILRPKILCKDIGQRPRFWVDASGTIVPLHSVYYIVPSREADIDLLCKWLNGSSSAAWLMSHCQRAANGFLRLQSRVLRQVPVPAESVGQRREASAHAGAV